MGPEGSVGPLGFVFGLGYGFVFRFGFVFGRGAGEDVLGRDGLGTAVGSSTGTTGAGAATVAEPFTGLRASGEVIR